MVIYIEHLIKIELKKIHFRKYMLHSALMIALSMYFVLAELLGSSGIIRTFDNTFRSVEMIFAFEFIILFAVLNSSLVISEYNNRTILLMFTYPVDKKKVILSKLMIVTFFTAVSMIVGYVSCGLLVAGVDRRFDLLEGEFTGAVFGDWILQASVTIIVFCCLGLWTFAAGMVKKSVAVTIVSSILFIFLRQLVITASENQRESIWVVLATVGITAAAMWYTFSKKIMELD